MVSAPSVREMLSLLDSFRQARRKHRTHLKHLQGLGSGSFTASIPRRHDSSGESIPSLLQRLLLLFRLLTLFSPEQDLWQQTDKHRRISSSDPQPYHRP